MSDVIHDHIADRVRSVLLDLTRDGPHDLRLARHKVEKRAVCGFNRAMKSIQTLVDDGEFLIDYRNDTITRRYE